MHPDRANLIALADADLHIAQLRAEVAALPKRMAEIEAKLATQKSIVEKAKTELKAQEQLRRNLEGDIKSLEGKISKFKEQSLSVKTNDQYRALMHEIEFSQTEIRNSEDKILASMEQTEALDAKLKDAEAELKRQSADVEKEKADARTITQKDEAELAEWNAKRDSLRSAIGSDWITVYDRVQKSRGNALAEVREQKCTACFVMVRPQKYQELRTMEQIHTCDSCGRILYYDPAHEPVQAAQKTESKKAQRKASAEHGWYFSEQLIASPVFLYYENTPEGSRKFVWFAATGAAANSNPQTSTKPYTEAFRAEILVSERICDELPEQAPEAWSGELPESVRGVLKASLSQAAVR